MFCFPPQRILVPLDLSQASRNAFRAAKLWAKRFGARIEVVYCDAPLPPELLVYGSSAADGRRRRRIEADLKRRFPGANARHVVRGEPECAVLGLIRRRRPDLVVLGTHGRRGLERAVIGSVAETILRGCPAPVLIVRRAPRAIRRVLAPLRGDREAQAGLLAAGLVARAFKARLDVLHVVTGPLLGVDSHRLMSTRLMMLPKDVQRDTKPRIEVRGGEPVEEILKAARSRDLLVLMSRPKFPLKDRLFGTTAQRLARLSPIPVLAIPDQRRSRP